MKDSPNCPFCQSEGGGGSQGWGMTPEGWEEMQRKHNEEHLQQCDKCGQSLKTL